MVKKKRLNVGSIGRPLYFSFICIYFFLSRDTAKFAYKDKFPFSLRDNRGYILKYAFFELKLRANAFLFRIYKPLPDACSRKGIKSKSARERERKKRQSAIFNLTEVPQFSLQDGNNCRVIILSINIIEKEYQLINY